MERRVGRRIEVDPVPVRWRVVAKDLKGRRRRAANRKAQLATLLEMSMSGLLIEAPASDDLTVGRIVGVEIDDVVGRVKIRRIDARAGSPTWRYGVEMIDATSPFTAYVQGALAGIANASAERWRDGDAPRPGRHTPLIEGIKVVMPVRERDPHDGNRPEPTPSA